LRKIRRWRDGVEVVNANMEYRWWVWPNIENIDVVREGAGEEWWRQQR
jgi:hypothetical protein